MGIIDPLKHALLITFFVFVMMLLVDFVETASKRKVFVMLYAEGVIPFSVLFTTSFIQDGHGMLPLLSYSLKDSLLIKAFNFVFGLSIGSILLMSGS